MKQVGLERVSVRFGKVRALENVDITVERGEIVALAGPNGSGKSTLIRVLLGLVRPDAGVLKIDGAIRKVDNAFKRELGYLPEAVAFAETLSGRQVLRFFASARNVSRRRVDEVLERVGLSEAARRAVRGYSRGMRQRLGIGIAILSDPQLLILDEPTGGLDHQGLAVLWSVLAEWREKNRFVLMASHDLTLLERRVDRICLLKAGRVCALDRPEGLRETAALPIRVTLHCDEGGEAANAVRNALEENSYPRPSDGIEPGTLSVDIPSRELLKVLEVCSAEAGVSGVRVEEPGLDLVYDKLLERGD